MKSFYEQYQGGQYSQNGEAGIIDECLKRIGIDKGIAVEFGAPTKSFCSNIYHLGEKGFTRFYFDPNPQEDDIIKAFITTENVNYYIPANCKILSVDIDGNDYNVWNAYLGEPEIVIIEINSGKHPEMNEPVSHPSEGTAYKPMVQLGINKGYFLICHTGNLIFVKNEHRHLFPEVVGDGIENWQDYFQTKWL